MATYLSNRRPGSVVLEILDEESGDVTETLRFDSAEYVNSYRHTTEFTLSKLEYASESPRPADSLYRIWRTHENPRVRILRAYERDGSFREFFCGRVFIDDFRYRDEGFYVKFEFCLRILDGQVSIERPERDSYAPSYEVLHFPRRRRVQSWDEGIDPVAFTPLEIGTVHYVREPRIYDFEAERREIEKKEKQALEKSKAFLLSVLPAAQRELFEKENLIEVAGSKSKKLYRINTKSSSINVFEMDNLGLPVRKLCGSLKQGFEPYPLYDHIAGQYLTIKLNEPAFLKEANEWEIKACDVDECVYASVEIKLSEFKYPVVLCARPDTEQVDEFIKNLEFQLKEIPEYQLSPNISKKEISALVERFKVEKTEPRLSGHGEVFAELGMRTIRRNISGYW